MNLTLAISGTVTKYSRSELEAVLRQKGHKLIDGINQETNYLICNDPSTNSDKVQYAFANKITIINEEDLEHMLTVNI